MDYANLKNRTDAFEKTIADTTLREMFHKCFYNTLDTTVNHIGDQVYIITGDIDAMWLRDSSVQVMQYLEFANECPDTATLIKGLIKRQMYYISCDPYANAFNSDFSDKGWVTDETEKSPIVFERKFELDSLCYPLMLCCKYYEKTHDDSVFGQEFIVALATILDVFSIEQRHENSKYVHYRPTEEPSFSVPNKGRGGECGYTGLIWSGYRPSDDPCIYGYFIPGNMFVSVVLDKIIRIADKIKLPSELAEKALRIKTEVDGGIERFGIAEHPDFGRIYVFETDGLGNNNFMDDANVPSLLSLPYLGYKFDAEVYCRTRAFCLSPSNPYYYSGKVLTGIGSPHTPVNYVWHISLIMEGITSGDAVRINEIVASLLSSTAGTGFMHEGVDCNDDYLYTRSWFAWANSLFSYFLLIRSKKIDKIR